MNKFFLMAVMAAGLAVTSCSSRPEVVAEYNIVPLPVEVSLQQGEGFKLSGKTVICYPAGDDALQKNAELLAEYLKTLTGNTLQVTDQTKDSNAIVLLADLKNENSEAYNLTVNDKLITINGASAAGNYYGINTLRKSIVKAGDNDVLFPAVEISDEPRFAYRGTHLDVSRHFYPADSVKNYIDMLALHNVNTMHWHLTDDQGWRVEIKSRPELTKKGSIRPGTMVGTNFNLTDSVPHGGFYTQDELRDIVKYAADRHIDIIPEIDLPGHMLAALKAYPELGCTGGPYEIWQIWGVSDDVLCAGNDSTLAFVDDVLNEVMDIFPYEYVHIGGDECPKVRWKDCPKCQAKIKELGLKSDSHSTAEQKLQTYVMNHASKTLADHNRKAIGWDEVLEGGTPQGTVIMSWRGLQGAIAAAESGHDAIMTPAHYCYFDYMQAPDSISDEQPLPYRTYLPIDTVYAFNPVPDTLTPEQAKHILGVQANVWTEYMPTYSYVQYKVLPRLAAMSEVQWTDPSKKDFSDFKNRLNQFKNQYDAEGYNYAKFVFEEETDESPVTTAEP